METYVILSKLENTVFVYHELNNQELESKYIYNIFDVLLKHGVITNNDIVILYQKIEDNYNVISLQHKDKLELEDFDKNDLEELYNKCVTSLISREYLVIENTNDNYVVKTKLVEFNNMQPIFLQDINNIVIY